MNRTTFSAWNKAALKRGNENIFNLKEGSRNELKEEGFPSFHYWRFDGAKVDNEGVEDFFNQYGFVISILYPKEPGVQPYRQCRNLNSLFGFLEKHKPLDRFNIVIGEQKKCQYGGTIISSDGSVLCELARGRQDILAHGSAPVEGVWNAYSEWGMGFRFSENCEDNLEAKELMIRALKYVRKDRDALPGYLEFFCCDGGIYFTDYKKQVEVR